MVCSVRDRNRFAVPKSLQSSTTVIEVDYLKPETLSSIPIDIDGAYYLIHSLSASLDFTEMEAASARQFRDYMSRVGVRHVVYLTGIVNQDTLSDHLASRKAVEVILSEGDYAFTALRAGIIIGSGSASFEIIRDLVEKLPVLITPKWVTTLCQPIGIRDVLAYLQRSLFDERVYNEAFDIYGPDVMTYRDVLMGYAKARGLRRWCISVPVMTPRLSSYWLFFVTSTTYNLAVNLVNSMHVKVVAKPNNLGELLGVQPMDYPTMLAKTFVKIKQNAVVSSWKDSMVSGRYDFDIEDFLHVPSYGCFTDHRHRPFADRATTIRRVWSIGGATGWYYATWLWKIRGYLDKLVGGVGLRRGRTHLDHIDVGDAVDFWRVIHADREEGRLLLLAEMRLPGDAWLEFTVVDDELHQTATFRPRGVWGRLYWYAVLPFHGLIFSGMLRELAR